MLQVAALKPFVSFGEYTVTAAAADSPLLCKERDGNSEISKLSSGGSKKQA